MPEPGTNIKTKTNTISRGFRWAIIFTFITSVIGFTLFWQLPPQIPLFFSYSLGKDQLAPGWTLSLLPITSLVFLTVNWQLAKKVNSISSIMAQILAWMTSLTCLLILIATINIVTLIF